MDSSPRVMASGTAEIVEIARSLSGQELALRATLVLLLCYAGGPWPLKTLVVLMAALALIVREFQQASTYWLLVATPLIWTTVLDWATRDNHKYLMIYWCLSIAASLPATDTSKLLRRNAALLVGLSFALAVVWKVSSPDYLDGRFFEFTLLTDKRFSGTLTQLHVLSREELARNVLAVGALAAAPASTGGLVLFTSKSVGWLAMFVTWWTVLIEAAIAISFLFAESRTIGRFKHALLITFGVTSYSVATVVPFGWMLMVLGLAQCDRTMWRTRVAYVVTFLIIRLYGAPWTAGYDGLLTR